MIHDEASATEALVAAIEDQTAQILLGPGREEWFFPLTMLPDGVCEGDTLDMARHDGRWVVLSRSGPMGARSIEDRLSRPLTQRTAEFNLTDLRSQIATEQ